MSEPVSPSPIVIVGAGQAGGELAAELRRQGYAGRIVMVGDEPLPPYKRPPLSKAYFAGGMAVEQLFVMQPVNFEKAQIEFSPNVSVTAIDRSQKTLLLSDGRRLGYAKLALTTGGRARPLPLAGADAANVFPLRSAAHVDAIRPHCQAGKRMVIIGGGFIGLETAAVAVKAGLQVTLLEGLPRVLARVTAPEVSSFFERVHREAGVDVRTGVAVESLVQNGGMVTAVRLSDGSEIASDFVMYGIGLIPNIELAAAAGLAVENGIVVDEFAQTSDPDIVAAGDCACHPSRFAGKQLRLESVQNAMEQGRAAARNLLGKTEPYHIVPWFWSDQYDCKLQMVGLSGTHDQVILRGDPATQRNFAAFYLKQGRLIAADTVSRPQEFLLAKKWVAECARLDAAALADEQQPLKTLTPITD